MSWLSQLGVGGAISQDRDVRQVVVFICFCFQWGERHKWFKFKLSSLSCQWKCTPLGTCILNLSAYSGFAPDHINLSPLNLSKKKKTTVLVIGK